MSPRGTQAKKGRPSGPNFRNGEELRDEQNLQILPLASCLWNLMIEECLRYDTADLLSKLSRYRYKAMGDIVNTDPKSQVISHLQTIRSIREWAGELDKIYISAWLLVSSGDEQKWLRLCANTKTLHNLCYVSKNLIWYIHEWEKGCN